MDINQIERAAWLIYRFCALHPDLCPHDMHWSSTRTFADGKKEEHYTCSVCGHEEILIKGE